MRMKRFRELAFGTRIYGSGGRLSEEVAYMLTKARWPFGIIRVEGLELRV